MLRRYEGVVAVETGHIAVHESGEVEFSVLDIPRFKCFKTTRQKSMKIIISPLVFARLQ